MSSARAQNRRLHILVADDSRTQQTFVARVLGSRGHRVTSAMDGREAISAVRSTELDVILMDIEMPEVNGLDAARWIRAHELRTASERTPIIAVTSSSARTQCLDAGMNEFLVKPVSPSVLIDTVEGAPQCSKQTTP